MIDNLTPQAILDRMRATYATCTTYQDQGCVEGSIFSGESDRTRPFSTAFVRPNRFRYEFLNSKDDIHWNRYIVAQNNSRIQSWWDIKPGIQELDSLETGLIAAMGVSGESSSVVPPMLMPLMNFPMPFKLLTNLERLPDSEVDGVICFSIAGSFKITPRDITVKHCGQEIELPAAISSHHTHLWIEKTSFLLHRIRRRCISTSPSSYEILTTYKPTINMFVPDDKLIFEPPETKQQ